LSYYLLILVIRYYTLRVSVTVIGSLLLLVLLSVLVIVWLSLSVSV